PRPPPAGELAIRDPCLIRARAKWPSATPATPARRRSDHLRPLRTIARGRSSHLRHLPHLRADEATIRDTCANDATRRELLHPSDAPRGVAYRRLRALEAAIRGTRPRTKPPSATPAPTARTRS